MARPAEVSLLPSFFLGFDSISNFAAGCDVSRCHMIIDVSSVCDLECAPWTRTFYLFLFDNTTRKSELSDSISNVNFLFGVGAVSYAVLTAYR